MARLKWFIRRPHVVDQLRERAGYPADADSVAMETELRRELDKAAENPEKNFLEGCKKEQFAVRVAIPGRNVVYAILKTPSNGNQKSYDYIVPTVLTTEMYDTWNKDGKLGSVADIAVEKRPLPKLKPHLHLRWHNGDGKEHFGDYCVDDVPDQIRQLLNKGVKRETIKVYKEIPFQINVSLVAGVTS
jgi:hypothetical protein